MVIGDMPFLSYGTSLEESVKNAGRFIKEADADAVKLETAPYGQTTIDIVSRLTELGIPVVGHIGLTPQRMNQIGGGYVQGRGDENSTSVDALVETAQQLEDAGAFLIILEAVTEETGKRVTEAVDVPTVGIGAGRHVNGQVLVINDVLGLNETSYKLSKQYVDLNSIIGGAVTEYVSEVKGGNFPGRENTFDPIYED
jgi:3-methyl-2-oxobutanoate hydroxymethyltransferase